ncbi:MAG: SpoIIE family protein phosphatase [Terriglobales bacterium]
MVPLFHSAKSPKPTRHPLSATVPELGNADLAAVYYGQRMGGDFYDFIRVAPNRILFGLLDVAGRFEENCEIISSTQEVFRTRGTELFAGEDINEAEAMTELCLELNRTILNKCGVRSCPAFAGCYNEDLGVMCYFNAGHTPGLVRDGKGVVELPATGLPLGLFSHATTDAPMVAMEPGAVLLLASRGIVEAKCKGEEMGLPRLKEIFQDTTAASAKEHCLTVLDQVQEFMCTPPTHDDVTALALLRSNKNKEER